MTKEEFAELLNGRQYREEITKEEEQLAKDNGLIVLFGASDDLAEFRGAIDDEVGAYDEIYLNKNGIDQPCECDCPCLKCKLEQKLENVITCIWGENGYSWQYKTTFSNAQFDILEDNEPYCKGIVFNIADLI